MITLSKKPMLAIILILILFTCLIHAQTPQLLNYQGKLTNNDGTPASGTYTIIFSIYAAAADGAAMWDETRDVSVSNGVFNVLLGSIKSFPENLFTGTGNRYLGIKVGTDPEMKPRFQLTNVAYAIHAHSAKTLSAADGDPVDAVNVDENGKVGIGTTTPLKPLHIKNVTMVQNPIIVENCIANTANALQILNDMPRGTFIIGSQQGSDIYFYWKDENGNKWEARIAGTPRSNNSLAQSNPFQQGKSQSLDNTNDDAENISNNRQTENIDYEKMITDLQQAIMDLKIKNDQLRQRIEKLEQQ